MKKGKISQKIFEMTLFSMMAALVFSAQVAMEAVPNVHLTGMFIILFTAVFRKKALIPLYLYVFLTGIRWGFSLSWLPYLYVWSPLWGMAMLVPKKCPQKLKAVLYPAIGALHGILFGVLYAPAQAILFGLTFKQTLAWIGAGIAFDVTHAIGNFAFCLLVLPLSILLEKILKQTQ